MTYVGHFLPICAPLDVMGRPQTQRRAVCCRSTSRHLQAGESGRIATPCAVRDGPGACAQMACRKANGLRSHRMPQCAGQARMSSSPADLLYQKRCIPSHWCMRWTLRQQGDHGHPGQGQDQRCAIQHRDQAGPQQPRPTASTVRAVCRQRAPVRTDQLDATAPCWRSSSSRSARLSGHGDDRASEKLTVATVSKCLGLSNTCPRVGAARTSVPLVVPCLDAREFVRLKMSADLAADAVGRQQRLHAGASALELKAVDRIADDLGRSSRQGRA